MNTADSRRVTLARHTAQPTPAEIRDGKPCARCLAEINAAKDRAIAAPIAGEQWRKVAGWPDYSVSSMGRVRRDVRRGSWPAGRMMTPCLNGLNRTYLYVVLVNAPKRQTVRLHGLVAAAFIGPRPEGLHINHKDGNRHNNAAANLEYVTRRQNEDHAVANALHAWGEKHGMAKLTEEAVWHIRSSPESAVALAARYGVQDGTIQAVRNGKTWRHLV